MNAHTYRLGTTTVSRVPIPRLEPPTPEEIERRRKLYVEVMELREEIGPIGIAADELIHRTRREADGLDLE